MNDANSVIKLDDNYLYGPDNYFLLSDVGNGDNIFMKGHRISIYRVKPFEGTENGYPFLFNFIPSVVLLPSRIQRIGERGGKILVADNNDTIKRRCKLIRDNSSKHEIIYFAPNNQKIYKELVEINREGINKLGEELKKYGIFLNVDQFGFNIRTDYDYDEDDNFIGKSFYAYLSCVADTIFNEEQWFEFDNCLPIKEDSEYLIKQNVTMNCYVLELIDTYNITDVNKNNIEKIKKIDLFARKINFGHKPIDTLYSDIYQFFELRHCGVSTDFLLEFEQDKCVYQITPICEDYEGREFGPIYGSRELY